MPMTGQEISWAVAAAAVVVQEGELVADTYRFWPYFKISVAMTEN